MAKEYTWAVISFVVIGAVAVCFCNLGASGALPMDSDSSTCRSSGYA